jgi:hypothetical protein
VWLSVAILKSAHNIAFPVGEGVLTVKVKTDEARVYLGDMAGTKWYSIL